MNWIHIGVPEEGYYDDYEETLPCPVCGADVSVSAVHCPYCESKIDEVEYD